MPVSHALHYPGLLHHREYNGHLFLAPWHPTPHSHLATHTHTLLVFKTLFPHSSHVVWVWLTSSRVECDSGSNGSSHPLPSMIHSVMAKYQPEMMLGLLLGFGKNGREMETLSLSLSFFLAGEGGRLKDVCVELLGVTLTSNGT